MLVAVVVKHCIPYIHYLSKAAVVKAGVIIVVATTITNVVTTFRIAQLSWLRLAVVVIVLPFLK